MADPKGFLKYRRNVAHYRPVEERVKDYREVEERLSEKERREQASRCMDCGVPFCHWACPLGNAMPEYNDKLFRGDWLGAWKILEDTGPFSEFTGRLCPALCEASCVLGSNDEPVTCRQNELAVVEYAYESGLVVPRPPQKRNNKKIAVVGSGPAGLSAAYHLNRAGFSVTVFEADHLVGGYLRYGIPFFKMEKKVIDRRLQIMEAEGIVFKTGTRIGNGRFAFGTAGAGTGIVEPQKLLAEFDAVLLAIGAREPRDLNVPGRELSGVYQALDYLSLQNRLLSGEKPDVPEISAKGKKVLVIGGGDTGSDCVGTAWRQGAAEVTQIEVMPRPPETRPPHQPWPLWAGLYKTTSSHEEGCNRLWAVNTKAFVPADGAHIRGALLCKVEWAAENGRPVMSEIPGSDFEIEADLAVLAMGFTHVVQDGLVDSLGLEKDERGNIKTDGHCRTSNRKVWAAGDSRSGASLIVRALADGRFAAAEIAAAVLP
ncbi:MAG: glutamate synthase subunit beta [Spirochaetaceae bacterium]|jgi:glutamate synthase (NADPH/NADH) small chain|nr:glutamate synthase subunit beta [Spirochaetaceae bacterium]